MRAQTKTNINLQILKPPRRSPAASLVPKNPHGTRTPAGNRPPFARVPWGFFGTKEAAGLWRGVSEFVEKNPAACRAGDEDGGARDT